jgi:pimeloyl-ACP methyl ester carboxylesterase
MSRTPETFLRTVLSRHVFVNHVALCAPRPKTSLEAQRSKGYAQSWISAASIFGDRITAAAWRSKPTYYAVLKDDMTITPDLERFLAKRMNSTTIEVNAGHLSMVSYPQEIANLILEAAGQKR